MTNLSDFDANAKQLVSLATAVKLAAGDDVEQAATALRDETPRPGGETPEQMAALCLSHTAKQIDGWGTLGSGRD